MGSLLLLCSSMLLLVVDYMLVLVLMMALIKNLNMSLSSLTMRILVLSPGTTEAMMPSQGRAYCRANLDLNVLRGEVCLPSYLLRRLMSLVALGSSTWNL